MTSVLTQLRQALVAMHRIMKALRAVSLYVYTVTPPNSFERVVYVGQTTDVWTRHKGGHKASSLLLQPQYRDCRLMVYLCDLYLDDVGQNIEWLTDGGDDLLSAVEALLINRTGAELNTTQRQRLTESVKQLAQRILLSCSSSDLCDTLNATETNKHAQ